MLPDVVRLAGGPDAIAKLAAQKNQAGQHVEALHLTEIALAAEAAHRPSLETRLDALQKLHARSVNSNERGWLSYHIRLVQKSLGLAER